MDKITITKNQLTQVIQGISWLPHQLPGVLFAKLEALAQDERIMTQFTLDYSGLAALVVAYSVATDHDALLALEAALPGTSDHPLITGPCEMAVDLLADGDGEIDGYRIIIRPDDAPDAPWLASHICRVSYLDELREPDEEGGLYDPAEVIENAVKTANELLDWSRR